MQTCQHCGRVDREASGESYCQHCCAPYGPDSEASEAQGERSIAAIAREILAIWRKPYFGAVPYLRAMLAMETVDDEYGFDSGRSIINYFLANAATWRGADARRVKAELKGLLKSKRGEALPRLLLALALAFLVALLFALLGSTLALAADRLLALASVSLPVAMPRRLFSILGQDCSFTQALKMCPVYSCSLPARKACGAAPRKSILRFGKRSICYWCYAMRGNYLFPNVQQAQAKRFALLCEALKPEHYSATVESLASAIRKASETPRDEEWRGLFRWLDSGDIFSPRFGRLILDIARALPAVRFWVPTRQWFEASRAMKRALRALAEQPNIALRLSSLTLDGREAQPVAADYGCAASYVATSKASAREIARETGARICPATLVNFGKPASEHVAATCQALRCPQWCYVRGKSTIYLRHG